MQDLISRQAAIEKISETIWDTAVANDVITTLKELPSAQPVQWISVNDRLPEHRAMADTGLRQLADRLTERYGTGKTIVDRVGDICVSIYCGDYHAEVFFSGMVGAYSLSLYRHGHPVYMSGDTDKKLYDLTYDDLIRNLDEYFPRVKAKQMEIEI